MDFLLSSVHHIFISSMWNIDITSFFLGGGEHATLTTSDPKCSAVSACFPSFLFTTFEMFFCYISNQWHSIFHMADEL